MLARLAQDDRDVLGREALLGDQARDVRGDQLELGALAAALQQQQGVARIGRPARGGLEQRALERVQRRARVVLGERRQLDVLGRRAAMSSWKVSPRPANAARPGS